MVERDDDDSAKSEATKWFLKTLEERGVQISCYEDNKFVEEYLVALHRLVVSKEAELDSQTETLSLETERINLLSTLVLKAIKVSKEILPPSDRESLEALARLAVNLKVDSPLSPERLLVGLDIASHNYRDSQKSLSNVQQLEHKAIQTCQDINSLDAKVSQAKEEFDRWGLRDCEAGIEELAAATETVWQKRDEYETRLDRLKSLWMERNASTSIMTPPTIEVANKMGKVLDLQAQLQKINESLEPYNQLPPDLSLASIEIEKARGQLDDLIAKRDFLLKSYR